MSCPSCPPTGCPPEQVCDTSVGCVPSTCSCDPATGDVICTADCGGGTCVPAAGKSRITGGGSSFGMCGGACKTDLALVEDVAQVMTSSWSGEIFTMNSGTLTAEALAQSEALATALVGVSLQDVYGCPDCADGGASYIDLLRDDVASHHAYEFWNPPPALEDADAFVYQINEALLSCAADALVTPDAGCVPVE